MGDNDAETMSNVMAGRYEFHSPEFDNVSDDARDLITNLLQTDKTWAYWHCTVATQDLLLCVFVGKLMVDANDECQDVICMFVLFCLTESDYRQPSA